MVGQQGAAPHAGAVCTGRLASHPACAALPLPSAPRCAVFTPLQRKTEEVATAESRLKARTMDEQRLLSACSSLGASSAQWTGRRTAAPGSRADSRPSSAAHTPVRRSLYGGKGSAQCLSPAPVQGARGAVTPVGAPAPAPAPGQAAQQPDRADGSPSTPPTPTGERTSGQLGMADGGMQPQLDAWVEQQVRACMRTRPVGVVASACLPAWEVVAGPQHRARQQCSPCNPMPAQVHVLAARSAREARTARLLERQAALEQRRAQLLEQHASAVAAAASAAPPDPATNGGQEAPEAAAAALAEMSDALDALDTEVGAADACVPESGASAFHAAALSRACCA